MNGEANGTMEEGPKSPITGPLEEINNIKPIKSEEYENDTGQCEDANHLDTSNYLAKDYSHAPHEVLKTEYIHNENENSCQHPGTTNNNNMGAQDSVNVSAQDNGSKEIDNNYNISIDSCLPSNTSLQGDSEVEQETHSIDENRKDSDRILNKECNSNTQYAYDGVESDSETSSEIRLAIEPKTENAVCIDSNSQHDHNEDTFQDNTVRNRVDEVTMLEKNKVLENDLSTTEVHEIESDNDDCVVTDYEKSHPKKESPVPLRRSSRTIKRKRYTDDLDNCEEGSDPEEIAAKPFKGRSKPIVINDTKALVAMAARQMKSGYSQNQKKEPTVVIIDTNSSKLPEKLPSKAFGLSIKYNPNSHLGHNINACGTTVTSVSSKINSGHSSHTAQPPILPSLTDDMFVVEAPSFIVPYVYEKPSVKPFREFVDILGKELEEQKAKAERNLLEKQKIEKEKREKEKQEKREMGEEVEDSVEENEQELDSHHENLSQEIDEKKKKKHEKKERRIRKGDEDDMSWDGESSADSDDDVISDEDGNTIIIKEKDDSFEEIKDVSELTAEKVGSSKTDNYFDLSLGKFFIDIGLNLVQECVQSDLLKQQNRKRHREKKAGQNTHITDASIASLSKNIEFSKKNNAPYKFKYKKCEFCSFKTESMLALAHHLETPHMKNNCYKCNFCPYEVRSPHDILYHMEAEHNTRGKLERAPSSHQCANCPFEDSGKGKLARHLIACAKKFKPEVNLAPPVEWEPPAKIPKMTRARNNVIGGPYNSFARTPTGNNINRPSISVSNLVAGMNSTYRPRGKVSMQVAPRPGAPAARGGVMIRPSTPIIMPLNFGAKPKSMHHQPSISITPLPRQPQPTPHVQPQPSQVQTKGTFVICEICDGYIKDLEQLRNHMQWIHKIKLHPKMIYNRPPLNCQKCQLRFFTDQGLERHLLGSHGLVTSSMQEAANKGKDAGRCPVCGRVYQWKLLHHVARDHNMTLKPAHLSYKCTVCTATFAMYKQFENHVYSAHSVVAKRVADKGKANAVSQKNNSATLLKPLKINDEITIIPQPVKNSSFNKDK